MHDLILPPPDQKEDVKSVEALVSEPVSIVAYEPKFDPQEGLWYCDIDFDARPAAAPFVRFGLARYQPNAIDGKELSRPIALDPIQIPARRRVDIHLEGTNRIVAEVSGCGFVKRRLDYSGYENVGDELKYRHLTDVPLQKFSIRRATTNESSEIGGLKTHSLVKAFDYAGRAIEHQFVQPIENEADLRWICRFDLPESIQHGNFSLVVEEIELFTGDLQGKNHPVIGKLTEVPGKFACTIALWT